MARVDDDARRTDQKQIDPRRHSRRRYRHRSGPVQEQPQRPTQWIGSTTGTVNCGPKRSGLILTTRRQ
jgi:hypothetical protein